MPILFYFLFSQDLSFIPLLCISVSQLISLQASLILALFDTFLILYPSVSRMACTSSLISLMLRVVMVNTSVLISASIPSEGTLSASLHLQFSRCTCLSKWLGNTALLLRSVHYVHNVLVRMSITFLNALGLFTEDISPCQNKLFTSSYILFLIMFCRKKKVPYILLFKPPSKPPYTYASTTFTPTQLLYL